MSRKLYVGNLPFSATESSLAEAFGECGTVESVKLITDRDTGQSRGFGFVEMGSSAEAQQAIDKMNGKEFDGRAITVNIARPQQKRSGPGQGSGSGFGRNRW
ncbi:MAG: RNA recognition motif domain-containing protein [Woeseiaceae bacterium]